MYLIERTLNMAVTVSNTYSLSMIYAGFKRVGTWWNYKKCDKSVLPVILY